MEAALQAIVDNLQQLNQQNQQLVQQLQAQPPPQAPVPPAPAPVYALSPALVDPDDALDYKTAEGKKIWKASTEPLTLKFDVEQKQVTSFKEQLIDRAEVAGWNQGQGNIMLIPDENGVNRHLIKEYGRLTRAHIEEYVRTYSTAPAGQPVPVTRRYQNDFQFYHCLTASLSDAGQLKVLAERHSYMINDRPSGSLFFKLLMQQAIVDTRATASHYRENLSNLDSYIGTVDSNIRLFNHYVKINRDGLISREESIDDLMVNLFKGYLHASDREFVTYMKTKKDQYDEGADITAKQLMQLALNKYETLVTEGNWKARTPEQDQLLALTAQFDKIHDENLRLSKALKTDKNPNPKGDNKKKSDKSKPKKKVNKNKKRQQEDMAWKKTPPRDGDPHTKQVNNKTWHWCPDHMAWGWHDPAECRLAQERTSTNRPQQNQQRRSTLNQAMQAILHDIECDEE